MKRIHKIFAGAAGTLVLAAVTAVVAAPNGPMAGAGPYYGMGMGNMGMMYGGMMGAGPVAMSAQGLAQLKIRLAIGAQQEAAWQAFAAKAAAQAGLMQTMHDQHHQDGGPAAAGPDYMSQHIEAMKAHLSGMQEVNAALKELYTVLTPEQRKLADEFFGPGGARGYGRGMHG